MAEKNAEPFKKEKIRIDKTEFVTKKEFYVCIMVSFCILLGVVLWQGTRIVYRIEEKGNQIQNSLQEHLSFEISNILNSIRHALEEGENPLLESHLELMGIDEKKKTVTVLTEVVPKEYEKGMQVTFLLSCDEKEPISVLAEEKMGKVFSAIQTFPYCSSITGKVLLQKGNLEEVQYLDELSLGGELYPQIDGFANYSFLYQGSKTEFSVDDIQVNVFLPIDSLQGKRDYLREPEVQVFHNRKLVEEISLQREWDIDGEGQVCRGKGKKRFAAEVGDTFTVMFAGTTMSGTQYTYILEQGKVEKNGEFASCVDEMPKEERLKIW